MKKILYITKNAIMFYCLIFTIGTLANTILWLYFGLATNPDVHGRIMFSNNYHCLCYSFSYNSYQMFKSKRKIVNNKEKVFKYGKYC
jgi:hypothetical protein